MVLSYIILNVTHTCTYFSFCFLWYFLGQSVYFSFNILPLFWHGGEGFEGKDHGECDLHMICKLRRECHSA